VSDFVPIDLHNPRALLDRLRASVVMWSWGFNALRLASGLILLPLVLNKLPTAELGMYYVLLSLAALVPLVDFGFGPTIGRFVSYAMGGAEEIQAQGVAKPGVSGHPNYRLLWELLFTTQALYRFLVLALFVVLGLWGTYVVELRIHETASPLVTRIAWGVTLVASLMDIYSNWWITYLRSMNEVMTSVRVAILGIAARLVIAAALLIAGAGLLSLPIGTFISTFLQRSLARRRCRQILMQHPAPERADVRHYLRILWPNTWRLGVQFISGYLTVNANTAICLHVLGLGANARYGLSAQLLTILSGMAGVWIYVKWPIIGQYRARHDYQGVQRIMRPRVWLQSLTFLLVAGGLLLCGPFLLRHLGAGKQLLPLGWLALMTLNAFFEMQFNIWGTLLSTENRLPYLWPTVATNVLSLTLSLTLVHFTSLELGALVLGPLLAGSLFNYWYWPPYAARSLGTTLFHLMFIGPQAKKPEPALVG
jgi:hypothetical protein